MKRKGGNFESLESFGCVSYVHIESNDRSKLGVKARKCFFINYGDKQFGYRFWDEQNRKIIRSRNVFFDEKVLYKDKSSGDLEGKVQEKFEFVSLDIPEYTSQDQQYDMGIHVVTQDEVGPSTPPTMLRRSSRTVKAPNMYSSSNYILLTNYGEPKRYKEILQDGNSSKWELAMKNEMDPLIGNCS